MSRVVNKHIVFHFQFASYLSDHPLLYLRLKGNTYFPKFKREIGIFFVLDNGQLRFRVTRMGKRGYKKPFQLDRPTHALIFYAVSKVKKQKQCS